jgi:small neutral amino acid transporter SnatA (MarC family)
MHTNMIEFAATVFITFLVIIDPIGMVPLFAALTQRQSKELRRRTATRSISVAAITLLVIALVGQIVLRFLGIGLPAFRIAGGLLLLLLSIDMVFARQSGIRSTTDAETEEAEDSTDVAIFPVGDPAHCRAWCYDVDHPAYGSNERRSRPSDDRDRLNVVRAGTMPCCISICGTRYGTARRNRHKCGRTRFGVVLTALAVQYIIDGVTDVLGSLPGRIQA